MKSEKEWCLQAIAVENLQFMFAKTNTEQELLTLFNIVPFASIKSVLIDFHEPQEMLSRRTTRTFDRSRNVQNSNKTKK